MHTSKCVKVLILPLLHQYLVQPNFHGDHPSRCEMESHCCFDLHFLNGADILLIQAGVWVYKQLDMNSNLSLPWFGGGDIFLGSFSDWEDSPRIPGANIRHVFSALVSPCSDQLVFIIVVWWAGTLGIHTLLILPQGQKKEHNFKKERKVMMDCPGTKSVSYQDKEIRVQHFPPLTRRSRGWGVT